MPKSKKQKKKPVVLSADAIHKAQLKKLMAHRQETDRTISELQAKFAEDTRTAFDLTWDRSVKTLDIASRMKHEGEELLEMVSTQGVSTQTALTIKTLHEDDIQRRQKEHHVFQEHLMTEFSHIANVLNHYKKPSAKINNP